MPEDGIVPEPVKHKLGPLPVWAWVAIAAGLVGAWWVITKRGAGKASGATIAPDAAPAPTGSGDNPGLGTSGGSSGSLAARIVAVGNSWGVWSDGGVFTATSPGIWQWCPDNKIQGCVSNITVGGIPDDVLNLFYQLVSQNLLSPGGGGPNPNPPVGPGNCPPPGAGCPQWPIPMRWDGTLCACVPVPDVAALPTMANHLTRTAASRAEGAGHLALRAQVPSLRPSRVPRGSFPAARLVPSLGALHGLQGAEWAFKHSSPEHAAGNRPTVHSEPVPSYGRLGAPKTVHP